MTEFALPIGLVGAVLAQAVALAWWIRGQLDRLVTRAEHAALRHRVNNIAVIVYSLAEERPDLRMRADAMIRPTLGDEEPKI